MAQPRNTPPHQQAREGGTIRIPRTQSAIDAAQGTVIGAVERAGYPNSSVFALRLALHEALMNAFKHGHKNLPDEAAVELDWAVTPATVDLEVRDQGPGFDPGAIPDPTLDENIERGTGRGLLLIRAYMSRVEYNAKGNVLSLRYERPA